MNDNCEQLIQQIIDVGWFFYGCGWLLVISSNYFVCLDEQCVLFIVLGKYKGQLGFDDVLVIDLVGNSLELGKKFLVEIFLYIQLYVWNLVIGVVLYIYLVNVIVFFCLVCGDCLVLQDYELQKVFVGVIIYEGQVEVLIFDNDQDIVCLVSCVQFWLEVYLYCLGYLICGYGLYIWGVCMSDVLCQVEVFEFLFECELKVLSLS